MTAVGVAAEGAAVGRSGLEESGAAYRLLTEGEPTASDRIG